MGVRKSLKFLAMAGLAGLVFTLARCGSNSSTNPDSSVAVAPTLTSFYGTTLSKACIQCHDGTQAANGSLNFSNIGTSYSTLYSFVSGGSTFGSCSNVHNVVASSPTTSYLAAVMSASYSHPNFGGQNGCTPYAAHQTANYMTSDEFNAMIQWIQNGAANN